MPTGALVVTQLATYAVPMPSFAPTMAAPRPHTCPLHPGTTTATTQHTGDINGRLDPSVAESAPNTMQKATTITVRTSTTGPPHEKRAG